MKKGDNKDLPAFPVSEETTDRIDEGIKIYSGLTKREYFAAKALQGLCAGRTEYEEPGANVKYALELADKLISFVKVALPSYMGIPASADS